MEYIDVTSTPPNDLTPLVLVIGKFDGVHRGHSKLLNTASEYNEGIVAVMSFSDHPSWILKGDREYDKSLTPIHHKMSLLQDHGVERFYNIQFTKEYARISAKEFVLDHLSKLNIKRIVVGEGFHLGKARESDTNDLIKLCAQIGIPVTVIPLLQEEGNNISSTTIRSLIRNGEVVAAKGLLGRPYVVTGHVVHGEALGRTLGFPTINLAGKVDRYVLPKPGVYVGVAEITDSDHGIERHNALISAGYRPTVKGETYLIEAYLLNFSGDLYSRKVSLSFLEYLHEEIKFSNLDKLVEQMKLDERNAFIFFENE
ncbi:bifunctional riboflavin kinase/FAD synthetase [Paenibacillus glacialis]|uniref:Riboflavin biosynthesis protein n=1 Tax=Paenibacillus glacialis TaxID=494026 RepID=A0A168IP90_9BACL|nr:bifunctional riboflavin kinase/FAD synthetase [Paenibacillus glacialis]OAB39538.1 riboflavin biosynthesis protein RibF [Paenibacillus glacialis]